MVKMLSNHSLGFYLNQVKLIFAGFSINESAHATNQPSILYKKQLRPSSDVELYMC